MTKRHDTIPIRSVIIDDDRSIGEVLEEVVSRDDISVEVFDDGREAIEYIKKQTVDIVITDLMMPEVGGLEVLNFTRQVNPDALVIIITGHASLETAIEAVKKGAYDYIRKPFKLEEVEISFNNAVERVRLVRKNKELILELKAAYDRLVVAEKDCDQASSKAAPKDETTAYLNFFSNTLPGFELLQKPEKSRQDVFERLENLSYLRIEGLLTDVEFKRLKGYLMKQVDTESRKI